MNPICIYTENEVHRFIITEKDIHLTHMVCDDEQELDIRKRHTAASEPELDGLYKRTLIRSLCIPIQTIHTPVLRLTNVTCTVSLGMKDRGSGILFHTAQANEGVRNEVIDLFNLILQTYKDYKAQIPSSPANPVAVTPFTNDETSAPLCQSVMEAAAATSPKIPMIPTSERRTNVSV
jgi:hypothetical protein